MSRDLTALLNELAAFGRRNDAASTDRAKKMLNITPNTGEFLELMVKATRARRILEIGTSNGYSTIWLAKAARATGGRVTTLEKAAHKVAMATENFRRAGGTALGDVGTQPARLCSAIESRCNALWRNR